MTVSSPNIRPPSAKHAVPLINAGFAQCRFIVSDSSPAMCCGAPTEGGSWCKWHREIVYEAARPRIRPARSA